MSFDNIKGMERWAMKDWANSWRGPLPKEIKDKAGNLVEFSEENINDIKIIIKTNKIKKFLYPRIQVKVFNEEILLVGLNQGVDPILKLQGRIKELNFGDISFQIQESEIQEKT